MSKDLILLLGLFVRLGLIASALAAVWAGARFRSRKAQRRVDAALVLLAGLSFMVWVNPSSLGHRSTFINWANMFHYYLGSKYVHEVSYFDIYGAAFAADAEEPPRYFYKVEVTRDLRNYQLVRPEILMADPQLKQRFSPERWSAFKADLAYIQRGFPPDRWIPILRDHGNNAPPPQSAVSAIFARLVGPADALSIGLLALLDPLLVVVLLVFVHRTYGLRTTALVAIFIGMNELCESGYIIGAFLRLDWLVAAGLGVCCLRYRRYLLAGCLLGLASGLRIFPVFFALAVVIRGGLELIRIGTWPPMHRRFVAGLALGGSSLFLLSIAPDLDLRIWFDFVEKLQLHEVVADLGAWNVIGLRQVLAPGSTPLLLVSGAMGLLFLASLPRVDDAQAAILGGTLVFAFLSIADYYYAFLLLFFLWQPWERMDARALIVMALLFSSASLSQVLLRTTSVPEPEHYRAASLALLVTFAVVFAQILIPRRAAPA